MFGRENKEFREIGHWKGEVVIGFLGGGVDKMAQSVQNEGKIKGWKQGHIDKQGSRGQGSFKKKKIVRKCQNTQLLEFLSSYYSAGKGFGWGGG